MKKAIVAFFCCLPIFLAGSASATEMTLIDSGICTGVVNHAAADLGEVFVADIGKLFCFTRVVTPGFEGDDQHVEHVWYYQETERARVRLPVRSANWGTYSSKIIQPFEIGEWRVEVEDPLGEAISVFRFYVKETE
jgi:hypothetical protein